MGKGKGEEVYLSGLFEKVYPEHYGVTFNVAGQYKMEYFPELKCKERGVKCPFSSNCHDIPTVLVLNKEPLNSTNLVFFISTYNYFTQHNPISYLQYIMSMIKKVLNLDLNFVIAPTVRKVWLEGSELNSVNPSSATPECLPNIGRELLLLKPGAVVALGDVTAMSIVSPKFYPDKFLHKGVVFPTVWDEYSALYTRACRYDSPKYAQEQMFSNLRLYFSILKEREKLL